MKIFFKIILISVTLISVVQAQKVLTLKDAISIALKESYGIKSAEYSLESSKKSLEAVKLGLRTSVDMKFNLPSYSRTLSSQFNPNTGSEEFYEIGYTTLQGQLFFTQPIAFTNGTFSLVGTMWKRNQFSAVKDIPTDYYSNLSLRLQQPLFTFNTLSADLERAEINSEIAQRNYSKAEKDVIYNVTVAFFRLYQAKKNVEIAEEKVKQNETQYNTAQNKFKAGLIAEVEALQLEVDLAASRNELLSTRTLYENAKNDFKVLIGIPIDENIEATATLEYNPVDIDLDQAVQYAIANRTELKNAESEISLKNLSVDEVSSKGNVSAMLSANYGINKNDNQFSNIFRDFAEDRNVVFSVSVPILDWGKNNRLVEAAEAQLDQAKLDYQNRGKEIKQEIIALVNRIKAAKARVEVLSKSVNLAQKSYDISLSRFESGNITSFDLAQMQIRLTDAKTNSLNALIDYKLSIADLERKTMHKYQ
ncbi:MAG TPA: TolC family protein [Ignavibacteriaceae bacterium]|nr:TolC family protein [Ignavibacteriaceae bacterium]